MQENCWPDRLNDKKSMALQPLAKQCAGTLFRVLRISIRTLIKALKLKTNFNFELYVRPISLSNKFPAWSSNTRALTPVAQSYFCSNSDNQTAAPVYWILITPNAHG